MYKFASDNFTCPFILSSGFPCPVSSLTLSPYLLLFFSLFFLSFLLCSLLFLFLFGDKVSQWLRETFELRNLPALPAWRWNCCVCHHAWLRSHRFPHHGVTCYFWDSPVNTERLLCGLEQVTHSCVLRVFA